eukprot:TRINITY_DN640_c0_g1_i3.p1 TRINITY_DN640_c0_g1~~TRINITY_DN640_c0_g1_i3.p1  ORF type:complete len:103 (+),score=13.39 TRINITY_DN640_c0_g1_i3:121-429(+)
MGLGQSNAYGYGGYNQGYGGGYNNPGAPFGSSGYGSNGGLFNGNQGGFGGGLGGGYGLSLIHISEPTRQAEISYAVFCLKKKKIGTVAISLIPVSYTHFRSH